MRDSPPFDAQAQAEAIVKEFLDRDRLAEETKDEARSMLEDGRYLNALEMVLEDI